jgi:hypothetical protein
VLGRKPLKTETYNSVSVIEKRQLLISTCPFNFFSRPYIITSRQNSIHISLPPKGRLLYIADVLLEVIKIKGVLSYNRGRGAVAFFRLVDVSLSYGPA